VKRVCFAWLNQFIRFNRQLRLNNYDLVTLLLDQYVHLSTGFTQGSKGYNTINNTVKFIRSQDVSISPPAFSCFATDPTTSLFSALSVAGASFEGSGLRVFTVTVNWRSRSPS